MLGAGRAGRVHEVAALEPEGGAERGLAGPDAGRAGLLLPDPRELQAPECFPSSSLSTDVDVETTFLFLMSKATPKWFF